MIKSINMLVAALVAVGTLTGCVTKPTIGSKPGDVPPRIIVDPANSTLKIWDKPGAFGPLPADMTAQGQLACSTLNTNSVQYKAIGYHPLAQDIDGKKFPDGGYFCVTK